MNFFDAGGAAPRIEKIHTLKQQRQTHFRASVVRIISNRAMGG